jgi:ribosome biogenesis GTPase
MPVEMNNDPLGWSAFFEAHWNSHVSVDDRRASDRFPARVISEERGLFRLQRATLDPFWGAPTGRARSESDLHPAVGDWVACSRGQGQERASIHQVLPRKTCLTRRSAGRTGQPQVLAANADIGFLVTSLNADLNPRRIERYLTTIWDSGARPVVLLTKRDLQPDIDQAARAIVQVAAGAEVLAVSAATGEGMEALGAHLLPGTTSALLGSSGAGKSTLINRLLGADIVRTQPIREGDDRGRHTTTSRKLWMLPSGALVIDTPGMRELQLCADAQSLDQAFSDLGALAAGCRFTDCRHATEPGCAVRSALEAGSLSEERLLAYDKLRRELSFQSRKENKAEASREKARWKTLTCQARVRSKAKRREDR